MSMSIADQEAQVAAEKHLDELVDAAAARLADNMQIGYADGFEIDLARDVLGAFLATTGPERTKVMGYGLSWLIYDRMRGLVTIDCLLDETDFASYTATDKMAEILLAEIWRQGTQDDVLRRLVVHEITERAQWRRDYLVDDEPDAFDEPGPCGKTHAQHVDTWTSWRDDCVDPITGCGFAMQDLDQCERGHPDDGTTMCGACGYNAPTPN